MEECVFCKIIAGEIPTEFVVQDDKVVVFKDINPVASVHLLIVPRAHVDDLMSADADLISHIHSIIKNLVSKMSLVDKGYRIIINGGIAKAVPHLHFHLLGEVKVERTV